MTRNAKIAIVVALTVSFAAGRFSTPVKIKTEIKTVEVERKDTKTDTDRDKHREVTVTETVKPDGTKTVVTTTTEDTKTQRKTDVVVTNEKNTSETKEVVRSGMNLTIDGLVGLEGGFVPSFKPLYGAHIGANVIGPIRVGIFGLSNGVGGVSIGLVF